MAAPFFVHAHAGALLTVTLLGPTLGAVFVCTARNNYSAKLEWTNCFTHCPSTFMGAYISNKF
jgi:hypothetical protein